MIHKRHLIYSNKVQNRNRNEITSLNGGISSNILVDIRTKTTLNERISQHWNHKFYSRKKEQFWFSECGDTLLCVCVCMPFFRYLPKILVCRSVFASYWLVSLENYTVFMYSTIYRLCWLQFPCLPSQRMEWCRRVEVISWYRGK